MSVVSSAGGYMIILESPSLIPPAGQECLFHVVESWGPSELWKDIPTFSDSTSGKFQTQLVFSLSTGNFWTLQKFFLHFHAFSLSALDFLQIYPMTVYQ